MPVTTYYNSSSEFLDTLQKTAKEAFGSEAQKFIDKAIYAKMPDHVKKILNRAYLEDKPYNDIVLHLEREMRLNGLGTPDETTLVPLNTVDVVPPEPKKELNQRGNCFHCGKYGLYKAKCRKLRIDRYYETKAQNGIPNTNPNGISHCRNTPAPFLHNANLSANCEF